MVSSLFTRDRNVRKQSSSFLSSHQWRFEFSCEDRRLENVLLFMLFLLEVQWCGRSEMTRIVRVALETPSFTANSVLRDDRLFGPSSMFLSRLLSTCVDRIKSDRFIWNTVLA